MGIFNNMEELQKILEEFDRKNLQRYEDQMKILSSINDRIIESFNRLGNLEKEISDLRKQLPTGSPAENDLDFSGSAEACPAFDASASQSDIFLKSISEEPVSAYSAFESSICYFGQPTTMGFSLKNEIKSGPADPKVLYEVKTTSPDTAVFIPIIEKYQRFRSNIYSLLQPVCDIAGCEPVDSNFMIVDSSNPGELRLDDDSWVVTKRCRIEFK